VTESLTPADRVVEILVENGYRILDGPLTVGSVPFDFLAVLVGTGRSADLIAVLDTVEEQETDVQRKVEGLSRALDMVGSRRPLTAILVGPKLPDAILEALGRVSRILVVGTSLSDGAGQSIEESLAVLLPLQLPDPSETAADSAGELIRNLPDDIDPIVLKAIMARSRSGAEGVKQVLRHLLAEPLAEVDSLGAT